MSLGNDLAALMNLPSNPPRDLFKEAWALIGEKSISRFLEVQASVLQELIRQAERQTGGPPFTGIPVDAWLRDHVLTKFLALKFKILVCNVPQDDWYTVQKMLEIAAWPEGRQHG